MQLARGQVGALALQTAPRQGPGRHTSASDGTHLRHAHKYLCIPCPALPRSSLSNIEDDSLDPCADAGIRTQLGLLLGRITPFAALFLR
jgi:hypothetical protein